MSNVSSGRRMPRPGRGILAGLLVLPAFAVLGTACSSPCAPGPPENQWFGFDRSEPEYGEEAWPTVFSLDAVDDHSYRISIWYLDPDVEPVCDEGGPCSMPGVASGPSKCGRISDADAASINGLFDPALVAVYRADSYDLADSFDESTVPTVNLLIGASLTADHEQERLNFRGDVEHQAATTVLLQELTELQSYYFDVGDFCSEEDARRAEQGGWPSP
jgi:hypothetical protein